MPQSSQMDGGPSRFSTDSSNAMLSVVLALFLFAMFFINNNNAATGRERPLDLKGVDQQRRNNHNRDTDFY